MSEAAVQPSPQCALPPRPAKRDEAHDFALAREINTQINAMECRNGATVVGSRPLQLGFDISSACNANCVFCLADKGRKARSDPRAFRAPEWMDHFRGLLPFINLGIFSSYEALLNPDFERFVQVMREYYTPFQIFTNGKALTPDMAEFCLENGLHSLHCSFHSPHPSTYEGIMRGLRFDQVAGNLLGLKKLAGRINPDFTLVMVFCAMRRNIEQLSDYVTLARRVGAKIIQVNYLLATDPAHGMEPESMYFHQALYDRCVTEARAKAARLGILLNHQPLFGTPASGAGQRGPCYKPWQQINVRHNGEVNICCGGNGSLGNIFESDFFEVWNSRRFRAFRRQVNGPNPPAKCRTCTRGREDPRAMTTHMTYLVGMPRAEREERMAELQQRYGNRS